MRNDLCPECLIEGYKIALEGLELHATDWYGVLSHAECPNCRGEFVSKNQGEWEYDGEADLDWDDDQGEHWDGEYGEPMGMGDHD